VDCPEYVPGGVAKTFGGQGQVVDQDNRVY